MRRYIYEHARAPDSPVTAPYWFEGWPGADSADRQYPLLALGGGTSGRDGGAAGASNLSDDRDVVEKIRAGDDRTFEQLYRTHAPDLLEYALRLSGSRAIAQDVVSELFVRLWEQRDGWTLRGSLRAYLYTATRHRVSNVLRTEKRADVRARRVVDDASLANDSLSGPEAFGQPGVTDDDRLSAVWRVVDEFPPLRRQVMYLRWARGLTAEEVASVLGLNRNAVDKHLSRAIQAIRSALPHLISEE